jgi:hypothetical protein
MLRLLHAGPQLAASACFTRQRKSAIRITELQSAVFLADMMASPCHDTDKLADRFEAANHARRNRGSGVIAAGDVTTTSSRGSERCDNPKLVQSNQAHAYFTFDLQFAIYSRTARSVDLLRRRPGPEPHTTRS